jgi:hypothetical protein
MLLDLKISSWLMRYIAKNMLMGREETRTLPCRSLCARSSSPSAQGQELGWQA